MPQFAFLNPGWPDVYDVAARRCNPSARMACFHARRALKLVVRWVFKFDAKLQSPYYDSFRQNGHV